MTQHVDLEAGADGSGSATPGTITGSVDRGPADLATVQQVGGQIADAISHIVLGKPEVIRLAIIAVLAEGHLLIEDVPGTGKTVLAKSLARTVDSTVSRVQFTPDLMPSDVTGVSIYDRQSSQFEFRPGPIFANIVVADEISPDSCRLWDIQTKDKLDKDRFRRDMGGLVEAYQEVARRLGILIEQERPKGTGPVLVQ